MKIETEIPDISRDDVIAAMASQLLGDWDREDPEAHWRGNALGEKMRKYLDDKIEELAGILVRERFDEVIKERIAKIVDDVLAEGWQVTNQYGEPRGPKVDLKSRVTEILTASSRDGYSGPSMTIAERIAKETIDKAIREDFKEVLADAKAKFTAQVDAVVTAKLRETLSAALGLPR